MINRLALVTICGGLLLCGCGWWGSEKPAAGPEGDTDQKKKELKTPISRALEDAIDEADGESQEIRDELKEILYETDEELSRVLGGNSRRLIEKANKKAPAPVVDEGVRPKPRAD